MRVKNSSLSFADKFYGKHLPAYIPLEKASEELKHSLIKSCYEAISMATSQNVGIKNSWSLIAFAKKFGKMQVGEFVNKETGEVFKSCIFTKGDTRTFVAFSSKMGELSPSVIARRKDDLQVVQLESGNYSLCMKGKNTWEDVDLDF